MEDLKSIEELCDSAASASDVEAEKPDLTPAFYFWLTLVKTGTQQNLQRARRLLSKHQGMVDLLEAELASYAKDYSRSMFQNNNQYFFHPNTKQRGMCLQCRFFSCCVSVYSVQFSVLAVVPFRMCSIFG